MSMTLDELKTRIERGAFPAKFPRFSACHLVITSSRRKKVVENDIVIFTRHAGALSWMVHHLKNNYVLRLNYIQILEFYAEIGRTLQTHFKEDGDLIDAMLKVLENAEAKFPEKESPWSAYYKKDLT
jgi:hypothetical protein